MEGDDESQPSRPEGVAFANTSQKVSEEARRTSDVASAERGAQLASAIEHTPALIAIFDREMRYLAASRRWLSDFRVPEGVAVIGRNHYEVFPEIPQRWKDIHRRCLAGAVERSEEDSFPRMDGTVDWLRWEIHPWRTPDGEIGGIVMAAEVITERKRAEEQRRVSEERLRLAIDGGSLGTWHWDFSSGELLWSDLTYAMFGVTPGTPMNFDRFFAAVHPDDRVHVEECVARAVSERTEYYAEFRVCLPNGALRWLACRGRPLYDAEWTPLRMEGVALDITSHKRVEQVLREGEASFRDLAEAVPHLVWKLDPNGTLIYANGRWRDYFGRSASLDLGQWGELLHPDDADRVAAAFGDMAKREHDVEPFRMRRHDGAYRWFVCSTVPVRDTEGNLLYIVGTSTDVEAVKTTEEALRESRTRLDTALRAAGMGTWVWEIDGGRMVIDESLAQLLGLTPAESQNALMDKVISRVHPDDRAAVRDAFLRARDYGGEYEIECRVQRPDASTIWIASKGRVEVDSLGRGRRLYGACVDITHSKRLEEELRQAQKMDAIGQLAGGVAHDFNNLLTVILGQALAVGLRRDLPADVDESVREIASAADRAASLTSQLLAFGRRQTMQWRDVVLDDVVEKIVTMLQRLLGEDIVLDVASEGAGRHVRADANMLAQVLLNLAVNARDAMPRGGRLTIRTSVEQIDDTAGLRIPGATAGTWVCISVSDTGTGISPEILPHIFEPFFTTKDVGKGTGLGLATVYGIVNQHRGWVAVDSTLGRGTTFKVFLPMASANATSVTDEPRGRAEQGRGELILVVEDERSVRSVVTRILERNGYRTISAVDGREALRAFRERGAEVDLLLTDVVMPRGISGTDLVAQLEAEKPGLRAILCSGYSPETVARDPTARPRTAFLQKPFRPEQLLGLVRRVLDQ